MDKTNKNETNPFFDPDKPGSVFIGIDRYHQYIPSPLNALTFVQESREEKTDAAFRQFLKDNVRDAKSRTYVPEMQMLRYDIPSMRDVPPPDPHVPSERYVRRELLPYLHRNCISPSRQVSLPDAVYCAVYKDNPDCGILKKYFMQEADYISFRRQQDERRKIYRGETEYRTPLKVVENDYGYLVFSGNEVGKEGFRECLQQISDRYFDPHGHAGHLEIYEYPYVTEALAPHIDASYRIDNRRLLDNTFEFRPENHIAASQLPDDFINGLTPLFHSSMEPTADGFMSFATRLHFDPDARTAISGQNSSIYRLLTVMKNGYMNIHEQPFSHFHELLPFAEKLEKITQVRSAADFSAEDFGQASLEIRKAADDILKRDFDVRGHRSLTAQLNDPAVKFTVGNQPLNDLQKLALVSGYALYIPENNREPVKHLQYCVADFGENRMKNSSEPFPVRTYTLKEGILQPLSGENPEKEKAVKKAENRNKRNTNLFKP